MVTIMAKKEVHCANIIIQVSLNRRSFCYMPYIGIQQHQLWLWLLLLWTPMDLWQTNFASFMLGISKADIASEMGSLWRVIAVTKVLSFYVFKGEIYLGGATIHTTTQLVVKYTTWAMVEVRNEPFVGFTSLVCLTNGKEGEFGELENLTLSD